MSGFLDRAQAARNRLRRALERRQGRSEWAGDRSEVNGSTFADVASAATEGPVSDGGEIVREGSLVQLRSHVVANRPAFQRWYADEEIARLLRHDQRPLNEIQSRSYFDTIIMPLSARGMCFAIHENATGRLIGTTALSDVQGSAYRSALFRIVIGEKDCWGLGYGTEATHLVVEEAFRRHGLNEVRLEVFQHNARALATYRRVGFRETGSHVEFVGRDRFELHVTEMALDRDDYFMRQQDLSDSPSNESSSAEVQVTPAIPEGNHGA